MLFDVINAIIASLALVISVVSLICQWRSSRFSITVDFNDNECFYFDPISTMRGNRESLLVSARISNASNQPIHISNIQTVLENGCACSAAMSRPYAYPSELPSETFATLKSDDGMLCMKIHDDDGYSIHKLDTNLITCPIYLQPYESITGFLLFPLAGESVPTTTLRFVTSRKIFEISHSFMSKREHETSF